MYATCDHPILVGPLNDPEYAYCGFPSGHAGEHGAWIF